MPVNDIWVAETHLTVQKNPNVHCNYYRLINEQDENAGKELLAFEVQKQQDTFYELITDEGVIDCVKVREVFPTTSVFDSQGLQAPGERDTTSAKTLPGQCSAVATLYGDEQNPNQFNRGRDFWHGALDADQDNGKWDLTGYMVDVRAYYQNAMQQFSTADGNDWEWGHFSRTKAKEHEESIGQEPPGPAIEHFWMFDRVDVKQLVRTQRRRQPLEPCEVTLQFRPT